MQYAEMKQSKFQLVFVVVGIALVVIILGIAGSLLSGIDAKLQDDAERQVSELTQQAANSVADHIRLIEQAIDSFTVQSIDFYEVQPALQNLQGNFGFIEVAFVGEGGGSFCADGSPYVCDTEAPAEFVAESGQLSYTAPYMSENGGYIYHVIKTVYRGDESIGELHIDVPIEMVVSNSQFRLFDAEGFFVLFDSRTGLVTMDSTTPGLPELKQGTSLYSFLDEEQYESNEATFFNNATGIRNQSYVTQLQEAVSKGETSLFVGFVDGEENYICVSPIGVADAYVCALIPEGSVRSEAEAVTTAFEIVFGIVLVCLLATLIMSFFFYQKRMEKKGVEMKTHLYGALSDSLDMAVNMYSPDDGVVTPIVAKAREIIGYPMAEFMSNKRIADKISLSKEGRDILDRIRTGRVVSLEQGLFSLKNRKSGELRWISYAVTPLYYEDKRQLLAVLRDSTNEKNLQLSMKDAMVAAEAANQAKSNFLSRMSHEIRTPMNAIIGMIQIAENHLSDQEKMESSLEKIKISSDHLLSLINDVLDISKIESGKLHLANEEFSFIELLENVKTVINTQAAQKEQNFEMKVSKLIEDRFMGDKTRLQQLLINLLSNSVKYTPKNGEIRFEVSQQPSTVRHYVQITFVVCDNGIGMSQEYQKHIFEPFVMEGRSLVQGTGLGMPIVKNILTMVNGDIQVESEIGKGTTFTVVLNLEQATKATKSREGDDRILVSGEDLLSGEGSYSTKAKEPVTALSEGSDISAGNPSSLAVAESAESKVSIEKAFEEVDFSNIRVLLVEDNELNAEIAKELLMNAKLSVDWAQNGKEACDMLEASEEGFYDIVLMDIQMPIMNGYEATKYIRKLSRSDARNISIVAMSANAFMDDVQASLRVGMNDHLSKPIDIRLILATIAKQVLGKK